ncbi:hypothetical protein [Glycomyces xiaoerkulensis]|uniref:hypothetical protein n=1 Tax=Glycomyces xiaoerkulensis TaxID=2038139 RepID=UPI000C262B9E|nr:hypothetical protein [Glycomyces xiaoerkulensis]
MTRPYLLSSGDLDLERLRAERAAAILNTGTAAEAAVCGECGVPAAAERCEDCEALDWLDDWGGLHSLDDGHDGSYVHEAVAGRDGGAVTLTCQCGAWSGSAPVDGVEEPEDLFGRWEAHVYEATGRREAPAVAAGGVDDAPDEGADHLRVEVERLGAERDRLADVVDDAVMANAELAAEVERLAADNGRLREAVVLLQDSNRLLVACGGPAAAAVGCAVGEGSV